MLYFKEIHETIFSKGNIVLVSSHILDIMENLCDDFILIKSGKTIYHGTMQNLKKNFEQNKSLEDIYMEVLENNGVIEFS